MLDKYFFHAAQALVDEVARLKSEAEKTETKNPEQALELNRAADWLDGVVTHIAAIEDVRDVEGIERIKEALANEAPNEHAAKAVKKPFGASMAFSRAFGGIRIQTHTQKHFDAQNNSWAFAPFSDHGDLTACHMGMESVKEVISSAGAAANGVVKVIKRIIEHEQHAGGADKSVSSPTPPDKALLYPINDGYVAVRPITPAWFLTALHRAVRSASAQKLADSLNALKTEWNAKGKKKMPDSPRIFSHSIRVRQIAKPANNGPMLNAIQGYVVQGVLLPPDGGQPVEAWIAKNWQDGKVDIEPLLRKAVKAFLNGADLINRISHQMHRLNGKEIKGVDAPENAGVRQAWMDAGKTVAVDLLTLADSIDLSVIKDAEKRTKAEKQLAGLIKDWRTLRERAWNAFVDQIEDKLTSRWKTTDWKAQFYKGFEAGVHGQDEGAEAQVKQRGSRAMNSAKKEKDAGYHLRIWMNVEAMDAGSFAPTLGLIPLTSVWGALHKWVERDGKVEIDAFKIGVCNLRLLDRASGSPVFVTKSLNGKVMKALFERENAITPNEVSDHVGGPMVNCIITQKSHTGRKPDKVEEPLLGEAKMSGQVLIEVDTNDLVDEAVLERIRQSISRSRFNGGFIKSFKVEILEDERKPIYGWYALSATDVPDGNPLEAMFHRLIRSNVQLESEPPFGFVQAGWQFLDVPEQHAICRNGKTFDWKAAEPVWKAVRWVRWNNPDATWWRTDEMEFETDGCAIGVSPN